MNFDEKLVNDLKSLKEHWGVSYVHISRQLGVSSSAIANFVNGYDSVLGYEKKQELRQVIDQYFPKTDGEN